MQTMILNKCLICSKCSSSFTIKKTTKSCDYVLVKCKCNSYPVIEGILYFIPQENNRLLANLEKNYLKTVAKLLAFSTSSKIFFWLTLKYSRFYRRIGFANFIKLLTILSFPKSWARYLLNREKIPSFFLGLLSLNLIKRGSETILDLGCGTGNMLPFYSEVMLSKNLIAIDRSFLNLFIAKNFFSKSDTTFICANLDHNLPIKKATINMAYMIDGFHYIKNKKNMLYQTRQILKKGGTLAVIHTINTSTPKDNYAMPWTPGEVLDHLKKTGFKYSRTTSNQSLWTQLLLGKKIVLKEEESADSYAYSFFASDKQLAPILKMHKKHLDLLKKTTISYYQDPDIIVNHSV